MTLLIGPLLRHVDAESAAIFVEVDRAARVAVEVDGCPEPYVAATFSVHDHHYALVEVTGLGGAGDDAAGSGTGDEGSAYRVLVYDEVLWPLPDSPFPASVIRPVRPEEPLRMAFGSCRTSVPHDAEHHDTHGVDALRTFALAMAYDGAPEGQRWPLLLLLLGDQVYADETSEAMRAFISGRRSLEEPPYAELKDYQEYAHLYSLAWSDPALRWLLSTLPSMMIFDDHDVRDDWNTSAQWRADMEATQWWHDRIVAALGSYWVYQHLGNLSMAERAEDELWRELLRRQRGQDGEVDLTDAVDAFAARVDEDPAGYRWSYARDLGESRLVVIDSRAARVLDPDRRAMLDEEEMDWLDRQLRGDCAHLLIGTSLPYLLPRGLHDVEAFDDTMVLGAWGRTLARVGERLRVNFDLEHWAAFPDSFRRVWAMVAEVAAGRRGSPPATITFLSGDVHHSYVARVHAQDRDASGGSGSVAPAAAVDGALARTAILQLVCSPIRNPLPRPVRWGTAALARGVRRPIGFLTRRSAKIPDPPIDWDTVAGPWYDNNLALLQVKPGNGGDRNALEAVWIGSRIEDGQHHRPRAVVVSRVDLP